MTCRISVDTEDVNRKIQALVRDREKLADVKAHQEENARLQLEIVDLRNLLESAKESRIKEIKQKRLKLSSVFSASEWVDKGLNTDDLYQKVEYYSSSIEQDTAWSLGYVYRGGAYYELHAYDLALKDYNRTIQIDPEFVLLYILRGMTYLAKGESDSVLKDFNDAIMIDPSQKTAYVKRGDTYSVLGKIDLALSDYNKVIKMDSNTGSAYAGRGSLYSSLDRFDSALKE